MVHQKKCSRSALVFCMNIHPPRGVSVSCCLILTNLCKGYFKLPDEDWPSEETLIRLSSWSSACRLASLDVEKVSNWLEKSKDCTNEASLRVMEALVAFLSHVLS